MPSIANDNHSIWSTTAIVVRDGETGASYTSFAIARAILSWRDKTRDGFVSAHAKVVGATPHHYDFVMVAISNATDDVIEGLFDVFRDGTRVLTGGVGKLYGLNQAASPSNYFKLYIGTSQCYAESWLISAHINQRFDFV